MNNPPMRLNRILSLAGITSRRKADELIIQGRVTVNGRLITKPGEKAIWGVDSIKLDGREVPGPEKRIYLILNKPFGYISSLHDPQGRPTVKELLKGINQRVYPVGRLDFDSIGLLIFTNDGTLAHRLMHPRYQVPRTYKVLIEGKVKANALRRLKQGIMLEDGLSPPARIKEIGRQEEKTLLRITIRSGRNRIIRRMLSAIGCRVVHLIRTGFGPIQLGTLKVGKYRELTHEEVALLKKMVGLR